MTKKTDKPRKRRTREEIEIDESYGFNLDLAFELSRDASNTLSYLWVAEKAPSKKKAKIAFEQAEGQLKDALKCLRKAQKRFFE